MNDIAAPKQPLSAIISSQISDELKMLNDERSRAFNHLDMLNTEIAKLENGYTAIANTSAGPVVGTASAIGMNALTHR